MKILRPEVRADLASKGSLFELMDNLFISTYNVTLDELDFICGQMQGEEINVFTNMVKVNAEPSVEVTWNFALGRKQLEIRNKYLKLYYEQETT